MGKRASFSEREDFKSFLNNISNPKSLFVRNYLSYCFLLIVSVSVIGVIFISQVAVYTLQEKDYSIELFASRIRTITEVLVDEYNLDEDSLRFSDVFGDTYTLFQLNVKQVAEEADSIVAILNTEGENLYYYNPFKLEEKSITIEEELFEKIISGSINHDFELLFAEEPSYYHLYAENIYNSENKLVCTVLLATPEREYYKLIFDLSILLLFTIFAMVIVGFILIFFITSRITPPLKNMSEIATKYARGNFNERLDENSNCVEIDELAISLNEMASFLAEAERKNTTFIENVSHELKTPMTSISGFVDGMLDGTISEDMRDKYLKIISEEVKRLSRLTVKMLQNAKISDYKFSITKKEFDFSDLIFKVVFSFENQINDKELNVNLDVPSKQIAYGDRDNIYQVVYNLIENAIKYVDNGGIFEVNVYCRAEKVYCEIINTGPTIPKEKLPNLFDRFYKVDSSRTIDTTGAGLGLFLVKKIILMHSGDINVISENNITRVTFTLPNN